MNKILTAGFLMVCFSVRADYPVMPYPAVVVPWMTHTEVRDVFDVKRFETAEDRCYVINHRVYGGYSVSISCVAKKP